MRNMLRCTFLSLSAAVLVAGCSTSNSEAPAGIHPSDWYQLHRATTTTSAFVNECGGCHVVINSSSPASPPRCFSANFDGRGCHPNGPGLAPHALDGSFLQGSVHGKIAKADLTFCQGCHSSNPTGGPGSNPRFNVGINNHSAPAPGTGCEQCHGAKLAHPSPTEGAGIHWAGPNSAKTYHYSAGKTQAACTLCHGVALDGVGGVGVSCKTCHAETTDFTLNCTYCHGFAPDGSAEPVVGGTPVNHASVPLSSHDQCATCHGVKITNAGPTGLTGKLNASANYQAFNKSTDTIGDHWNGKLNMNGPAGTGAGYNSTNFGCDSACHANNTGHRLTGSGITLAYGNYGSGGGAGAPHEVGNNWLLKSQHATQAVNGTLNCLNCHKQTRAEGGTSPACQDCHKVAPKMDLTNNGCTSCHSAPPNGVTPGAAQPNRIGKHGEHGGLTATTTDCSSCHLGGGSNSLTHYDRTGTTPNYPADVSFLATYNAKSGGATYSAAAQTCSKVSCHGGITTPNWYTGTLPTTPPATSNAYCLSCHTFGTTEYNGYSSGQHNVHVNEEKLMCVYCHNVTVLQNGVGGSGPTHWSNLDTSNFELDPQETVSGAGTRVTSFNGTSCANVCHGTRSW